MFAETLDLLLDLARRQKVDLSRISVLALAEQYLGFIETVREKRIEIADHGIADFPFDFIEGVNTFAGKAPLNDNTLGVDAGRLGYGLGHSGALSSTSGTTGSAYGWQFGESL